MGALAHKPLGVGATVACTRCAFSQFSIVGWLSQSDSLEILGILKIRLEWPPLILTVPAGAPETLQ